MVPLQINEFLCFLTVQFNKINRENLITTLVEFYSISQALEAKTILIAKCKKISLIDAITQFTGKRVEGKSGGKGAFRRVVTDVVDIWTVVGQWLIEKNLGSWQFNLLLLTRPSPNFSFGPAKCRLLGRPTPDAAARPAY